MIKLTDILREIGENTATPYVWTSKKPIYYDEENLKSRREAKREFTFVAEENKVPYAVVVFQQLDPSTKMMTYTVEFAIVQTSGERGNVDYDLTSTSKDTKTGNWRRVMATVMEIIQKEIVNDKFKDIGESGQVITIKPSKEDKTDSRRTELYKAYIKKNLPTGAKVRTTKGAREDRITVTIPRK